jgi:hypothetical protein
MIQGNVIETHQHVDDFKIEYDLRRFARFNLGAHLLDLRCLFPLIVADGHRRADFHIIVKELRSVRRHPDTTMRCGISWQNPNMHSNASIR